MCPLGSQQTFTLWDTYVPSKKEKMSMIFVISDHFIQFDYIYIWENMKLPSFSDYLNSGAKDIKCNVKN